MIAAVYVRETWPSTYFDLRSGLFIPMGYLYRNGA
jgi:hypothetical protein